MNKPSPEMPAVLDQALYTPQELARRLRVNAVTVRRMCERGQLPGAFRAGNRWRIPASDLHTLTANRAA